MQVQAVSAKDCARFEKIIQLFQFSNKATLRIPIKKFKTSIAFDIKCRIFMLLNIRGIYFIIFRAFIKGD